MRFGGRRRDTEVCYNLWHKVLHCSSFHWKEQRPIFCFNVISQEGSKKSIQRQFFNQELIIRWLMVLRMVLLVPSKHCCEKPADLQSNSLISEPKTKVLNCWNNWIWLSHHCQTVVAEERAQVSIIQLSKTQTKLPNGKKLLNPEVSSLRIFAIFQDIQYNNNKNYAMLPYWHLFWAMFTEAWKFRCLILVKWFPNGSWQPMLNIRSGYWNLSLHQFIDLHLFLLRDTLSS